MIKNSFYSFKDNYFQFKEITEKGYLFINNSIQYYFDENVINEMVNLDVLVSKPVPLKSIGVHLGIIHYFLNHGSEICSITYKTKGVEKTPTELKEEQDALITNHIDNVINARNSKKSMVKASENSLREILDKGVFNSKGVEEITLIGKKLTFYNEFGNYKFLNFADNKEYTINLEGITSFTAKGIRYYINQY